MKQLLILLIITGISCKAQTIVPYESDQNIYQTNSGNYYKDTNNVFNIFEGEWKWEEENSNSSLIFLFRKEDNINDPNGYSYDLLIGEYKYTSSGAILANTLASFNDADIEPEYHKISGIGIITKYNRPTCPDCAENEKRMQVSIEHDNYDRIYGKLIMRHIVENGIEKIELTVLDGPQLSPDPNSPDDIDIPFGEYVLIKQ